MGSLLALGFLLLGGTLQAQTTLDTSLSGSQTNPSIPPLPSNAATIYVDATNGSDTTGDGSQSAPYRTITYATGKASAGTIIQLFPGTYSEASGETFPIQLKAGQILRGDESTLGEGYLIVGGGTYISPTVARQNVTMLAGNDAQIRGVSMRNEGRRGYALWLESTSPKVYNNSFVGSVHDGIFMTGNATAWVEGNRFYQNGANGISVLGTSTPTIVNNLFQETGFGITIDQKSAPQVKNNRVTQNRSGIIVGGSATPVLRGNLISSNLESGLVAITAAQPDLGTAQDPGNNAFEGNGQFAIQNSTRGLVINANGNQLSGATKGEIDLSGQATASAGGTAPEAIAAGSLVLPTTEAPPVAVAPPIPTGNTPSGSAESFQTVPFTPEAAPNTAPTANVLPDTQSAPILAPQATPTPVPLAQPVTQPDPRPSKAPLLDITTLIPVGSRQPSLGSNPQPVVPSAPAFQVVSPPSVESPAAAPSASPAPVAAAPIVTPVTSDPTPNPPVLEPTSPDPAPTAVSPRSPATATPKPALLDITTLIPVGRRSPQAVDPVRSADPTVVVPPAQPSENQVAMMEGSRTQFRVLVTPKAEGDLSRLQQLVPDASATTYNGRPVLQAGIYTNRNQAQTVLDQLLDAGFDAVAEILLTP
jgi:parallel beta-helix repeat protein